MVTRYDFVEIKADVTEEGWIKDNPIVTRSGIFQYRTPDGKVRNEYRPETEVFKADSLITYLGKPITDGHNGLITKDNPKGIIGTIISSGVKDGDNVRAELIIHDPNKLGSRKELSCGYTCDLDDVQGEHNGQKYDCSQRNIRINHLAVVVKGRAGNAKLRLDSYDDGVNGLFEQENEMADVKLAVVKLDGIDYQASPEVINALNKRQEQLEEMKKKHDTLEAERDTLKADTAKHKEEIEKIKNDIKTEVTARAALDAIAKQYEMNLDEADTVADAKKKILSKLRPTLKLDGKSDEYIASAFDLTIEGEKEKNKSVSKQIEKTVTKADSNDGNKVVSAEDARSKMIAKMRGQHFQQKTA
jgi:hypothetical protein